MWFVGVTDRITVIVVATQQQKFEQGLVAFRMHIVQISNCRMHMHSTNWNYFYL
eukprot:m.1640138 g.1640138  ORF g.1640138 m.1640138 type:complete len:54 (-) comp39787_c0_seq1:104-265(-)